MAFVELKDVRKTYQMGDVVIHASDGISFSVEKGEKKGRTFTNVERLDRQGRVDELARLIGGATVTDVLRQSASELLEQADAYHKQ